mgnify:CR=1 FL=1
MSNLLSDVMTEMYRETLSSIYETVIEDKNSPLTFADLAQVVKDKQTELATLRAELERTRAALDAAGEMLELSDAQLYVGYDGEKICDACELSSVHASDCEYVKAGEKYAAALARLAETGAAR